MLVGDNQSVSKCNTELRFSEAFCGYTKSNQINKEDKTFIANELENCFESNLIALKRQLDFIKSQFRKDQNFEWEHDGKIYRLNAANQIEEVQNALSDQDIIAGNWAGEEEQKMRFHRNEKGIIQLKAFGFRKDLPIVKDKQVDLQGVSQHILTKTNVYFKDLEEVTQKAPPLEGDAFADGRKIAIDKDASYIRVFSEGVGITKTLLKTGEVESGVYLDNPKERVFVKVPGTATGSVEAGVTAVTDITGTVVMIYDLATDENTRKETYEGLVKIKDEIKEKPSELFPILADIIAEEATGLSVEDWKKTQAQQTDEGEKSHLFSKGTVRTTLTAFASGSFITKLPKMADDLVVKMKRAKGKIRKFVENPFDEAGNLKTNVKFKTGEFEYFGETDELGRLERFETDNLQLTSRTEGLPHNPNTPDKLEGDHSGHIFGDRFGGSPELDNLVSQSSKVNLSTFKKLENKWAKALNQNKKVEVEIKIRYDDNSKRPSSFEINYKIGIEKYSEIIENN